MFLLSFTILIVVGSSLLLLPEMTTGGMSLIDAIYTSTSSVCVTGLIVVDTATAFTHKGHLIIMVHIQLSGINILALAALIFLGGIGIPVLHDLAGLHKKHGKGLSKFRHLDSATKIVLIFKAMAVAVIYAIFFIIGSIALSIAEPDVPIIHLIFEEISALSTVGLTIGITPVVGLAAKIILTLSMLIGRVGSLTIMMALLRTRKESPVKYPHAQVMIG